MSTCCRCGGTPADPTAAPRSRPRTGPAPDPARSCPPGSAPGPPAHAGCPASHRVGIVPSVQASGVAFVQDRPPRPVLPWPYVRTDERGKDHGYPEPDASRRGGRGADRPGDPRGEAGRAHPVPRVGRAGTGQPPDPVERAGRGRRAPDARHRPGEDHDFTAEPRWAERFEEQARKTAEAWQDPDAWEGNTSLTGNKEGMPAEFIAGIVFGECVVHGWDLAAATGREPGFPPEVVQAAWEQIVPTAEMMAARRVRPRGPRAGGRAAARPRPRLAGTATRTGSPEPGGPRIPAARGSRRERGPRALPLRHVFEFFDPRTLRPVTHRHVPCRRRPLGAVQLGDGRPVGRDARAAGRGHRRLPQQPRMDRGHHPRPRLARHGRRAHEGPYFQSANADKHAEAAHRLRDAGRAYYCDCGREAVVARTGDQHKGYDGFCRDRGLEPGPGRALRFRTPTRARPPSSTCCAASPSSRTPSWRTSSSPAPTGRSPSCWPTRSTT